MRSAFEMRSRWWTGSAQITTFSLEELLGTKLRALFQRKKGRDLYDVWYALKGGANAEKVVTCFARYMRESGRSVSRAEFEQNLAGKLEDPSFLGDITPLLRMATGWDPHEAARVVSSELIERLPGLPWKRPTEIL